MRRFGMLLLATLGCATSGAAPRSAGPRSAGPFGSESLAISERTATGFTAEAQLTLDNPGPGTMRIRGADYQLTVDGRLVAKGDKLLDQQTAEVGERQGVVVTVKADLGAGAAALSDRTVQVRMIGTLHISQDGDRALPYDVAVDVREASLIAR